MAEVTTLALDTTGGVPVAGDGAPPGGLVDEPGQVQYGPMLLGVGSKAAWRDLNGWRSTSTAEVSDTPRPQAHGVYPGDIFGSSQVVTMKVIVTGTPDQKALAIDTLERHTPMDGVERTLVVDDGSGPWQRMARVKARDIPQGRHYRHGPTVGSIQWVCADPRRYSLTAQTVTVATPSSSGGLGYPLDYSSGLHYGTFTVGSAAAINTGSVATPLVAVFRGPLDVPVLTANGQWRLGFDLTLADGETLTVDTADGTVLLNGTADRLDTITTDSDPIERCLLPAGRTDLNLTSNSGTGTVDATFRHARM